MSKINLEVIDLAVIGGGPGGYTASIRASQSGKKVVLFEKDTIGGVCLNRGCIPTKSAIDTLKEKSIKDYEVDKSRRMSLWEEVQKRIQLSVKTGVTSVKKLLENYGIRVIQKKAFFEAENILQDEDGIKYKFNNCIIATGTFPFHPFEINEAGIFTEENWMKMENLPQKILIAGGGVAGLELAYLFRRLGCEVILVEMLSYILPFLDKDLSEVIEREMKKNKVKFYKNFKIEDIKIKGKNIKVEGSGESLEADSVIFATGRKSSSVQLNCDKAGIKKDEKGFVKVDKNCRTSNHRVFAIGDVTGPPFLAHRAYSDGYVSAENVGGKKLFRKENMPYAIFSEPEVAGWGVLEREGKNLEIVKMPLRITGRAHASGKLGGLVKILFDCSEGTVRGIHLISSGASEIISALTPSLEKGITIGELGESIFIHPTFSEVIKEAALLALGKPHHYKR